MDCHNSVKVVDKSGTVAEDAVRNETFRPLIAEVLDGVDDVAEDRRGEGTWNEGSVWTATVAEDDDDDANDNMAAVAAAVHVPHNDAVVLAVHEHWMVPGYSIESRLLTVVHRQS